MKVYVDEIPENCLECKFCTNEECIMNPCIFCGDGIPNDCELNLLLDHDKEVRKQVCDEIREKVYELRTIWCDENKMYMHKETTTPDYILGSNFESAFNLVLKVLDQIEKGE